MPPRVLFLTTDYPPDLGGLETYSFRIARDLPGGLLTAVIAGTREPLHRLPPPSQGVTLQGMPGRDRMRALIWSSRAVIAHRMARRYDVSLHMQWSTAVAAWLLSRVGLGRPYVILIHGAELIDPGRPWLNRLKAAVLEGSAAVVAGSRATADLFFRLGLAQKRLEVIPYGNPAPSLTGSSPGPGSDAAHRGAAAIREVPAVSPTPVRLLCMHRLVARKGTALLLEALAGLKDLPWTLRAVGRGEEENALRARARELGLDSRMAFEPPVDEERKPALLDSADLFILPSLPPEGNNHMEGLGLGLLEAQGRGIPVLGARTGGIPEAVAEGRTGLLFTAGDAGDLRKALRTLITDADLRARLGAAGPGWIRENFDWEKSLARLAGLLKEVAGG